MIHVKGLFLFLFIPLVLYLFLQHPFGVLMSFAIAIFTMLGHRFIARAFFLRWKMHRCFWCGRTGKRRETMDVQSGKEKIAIQACEEQCSERLGRFFAFTHRYKAWIRIGIFLPLVWYIVTMLLHEYGIFRFPEEWNRFIFQFFIACTVVTISFAYRLEKTTAGPAFSFPIHNLFLLCAKNTLLVFRYVGIWWIAVSLLFLWKQRLT